MSTADKSPAVSKSEAALECIDRRDYEQAAQLFGQAVAESNTSNLQNDLGFAQLACGRIQEAEASFRAALALGPDNTQAAINLGALLACTGRVEAAVPLLEQGVSTSDQAGRVVVRDVLAICKKRNQGSATGNETSRRGSVKKKIRLADTAA